MTRRFLPRHRHPATGWAHPYGHGPFSPYLYADGGDGDGSASGSDAAGSTAADTSADGTAGGQTTTQQPTGQGTAGDDLAATVKRLEKDLADARKEAAKERTAAKQQAADTAVADLTAKLGKALGLVKDDGPPDPKALADAISQKDAALTEREAALRAKDVELAVWSRADKAGARAAALLDSRAFLRDIGDLDPSDKGFTAALDAAIKTAVKDNPAFSAVQAAAASGGDLSGGTGEASTRQRPTSLSAAVRGSFGT
ncbi:hypothetical protein [Streptomyces erythrochromogenes]|uniref:hypothetical protein n=1 Tax=Streptomyces erythrochromogenes TaxID=285574 RepID=UPI0022565CE4|nr:hypothetical protein [Streptomyces erythrochromogenes]MCX5587551.1 hypothetical protein [Streptomyces erythrochromogenes]